MQPLTSSWATEVKGSKNLFYLYTIKLHKVRRGNKVGPIYY